MIGGNVTAELQIRTTVKNEIGESIKQWSTVQRITGWLDYQSGDSKYTSFSTKAQESTHVFVADYVAIDPRIVPENSRLKVNGKVYDVLLIDNPMELNKQLEIYLSFTGANANG